MGYVCVPEKGLYILTDKGKEVLTPETIAKEQAEVKETLSQPETIEKPKEEIPQPETITKEQAEVILAYSPHDKAFHFYVNVGQPLDLHAHGLRDFANKVERVDVESVQFHMNRSDFEAWFVGLGDTELAKKVAALKEKNVVGDDLRKQLHELVEQRYMELAKLAGQPICIE